MGRMFWSPWMNWAIKTVWLVFGITGALKCLSVAVLERYDIDIGWERAYRMMGTLGPTMIELFSKGSAFETITFRRRMGKM